MIPELYMDVNAPTEKYKLRPSADPSDAECTSGFGLF
jgi:hypothetical protein